MKNIFFGLLVLGALASCSGNEGIEPKSLNARADAEQDLQKWQLVEMSGSIANVPPSTGSDMAWQEYYLLYADSTFVKSREQDGTITEASGTYALVTLPDGEYLELTYDSDNNLIGNCTAEAKELLFFQSANKLIGTWQACDGPGLVYDKVEGDASDDL
ncbi:MAG: hypothetical protein RIG62_19820 [Cyclobacteriaceae bacterium]